MKVGDLVKQRIDKGKHRLGIVLEQTQYPEGVVYKCVWQPNPWLPKRPLVSNQWGHCLELVNESR